MKHRYHCFVLCLLSMAMVGSPAIGDKITTTFTFGKIETLKTGEVEWTFLGKDSELADTDLVRMPPRSFIRLKDAHGTLLDTLPGSRELRVRDLIREGHQRKQANKETKRINGNSDKRPATDVLPLGNRPEADKATKSTKTSHRIKVTTSELIQLRGQLDALPEEIAREGAVHAFRNNVRMDGYPNPTLQMAKTLYDYLNRLESPNGWSRERAQKTSVIDNRALLYAQLLRHLNIGADLAVNEANELLVVFDSKIPLAQAKRITANQNLIHKKQAKDTVWLSILVCARSRDHLQEQPQNQNFITAWYEGSRMQLVQD